MEANKARTKSWNSGTALTLHSSVPAMEPLPNTSQELETQI